MRKIKLVAVLALLSISLFSCSGSGPEATAKQFVTLTSQGDLAEAKKLCTAETASLLAMAEGFMAKEKDKLKEQNKNIAVEVISTEITDDKAKVKYKITGAKDATKEEQEIDLVKIDGDWKVNINKEGMGGAK